MKVQVKDLQVKYPVGSAGQLEALDAPQDARRADAAAAAQLVP